MPHRIAALCLAALASACASTGLSLGDPNEVNARLDPQFIEAGELEPVVVVLSFTGVEDDEVGTQQERVILVADFGPGLVLREYFFHSNFRVSLTLQRFGAAEPGIRAVFVQIHNHYGTFLARGEFGVF